MPQFIFEDKKIFYEEFGEGVPIVFIHPPGMGRKVFYQQYKLASKYHVIFPDLSGNGDSPSFKNQIRISDYAQEIKQLLDVKKITKAVICGYSAGGSVAQEFVLNNPDRTIALILSGGFPIVNSAMFHAEFKAGIQMVKRAPNTLMKILANSHTKNKQEQKFLIEHMQKSNQQVWADFYLKSEKYDCTVNLKNLKIPLLLMYGSKADWINKHQRFYQKYCEEIETKIIEGTYHQLPTKKWEEFNQNIDEFLKKKV